MTGQGQGRRQCGSVEISAEVRAVNNRHLKVQIRTCESLAGLESRIEALVRNSLRRGSLQLSVQLSGGVSEQRYRIQTSVLASYYEQCQRISQVLGIPAEVSLRDLLPLPGAVAEQRPGAADEPDLPADVIDQALGTIADALICLNRMRSAEGQMMASELGRQLKCLEEQTTRIEQRAPAVIEEYRARLEARLAKVLGDLGGHLHEADVAREVLIMADKADIREEIVRLRSHFAQFEALLRAEESQGRKLDFLIQELFRETNTIGAKAGDADIAQRVVDIKTVIEQMRELVQNVE